MLAKAQEKVAKHRLTNRVKLHQGLTHELPLTPLYDAATCILAMHFLPDDGAKLLLLQSISQRLKPGAKLILVDLCEEKASERFNDFLKAYKYHARNLGIKAEIIEEAATIVSLKKELLNYYKKQILARLLDFSQPSGSEVG